MAYSESSSEEEMSSDSGSRSSSIPKIVSENDFLKSLTPEQLQYEQQLKEQKIK